MNADSGREGGKARRYRRWWRTLAVLLLVGAGGGLSAAVGDMGDIGMAPPAQDAFHRGEVMDLSEMAELRGGFNIGGMQMDFGAELRSLIDDKVQLVTKLNFTRAGETQVVSQTFQDPTGSAVRVGPDTGLRITDITPQGVDLPGLENFSGIAIQDQQGFTAALHNITQNAILSGVVSNASGKHLQQSIDVSIHLSNVRELRATRQQAAILDSLSGLLR